jgi:hypothetical protein
MIHQLIRAMRTRAALAIAATALIGLVGCGPGRGNVAGKVSYKGRAVVFGSVQFVGSDNTPTLARIEKDGSYHLDGAAAGEQVVLVNSPDPASSVPLDKAGKPREAPPIDPALWFPIPDKYANPQKSDLKFTIKPNTLNSYNIDLK